MDNARIHHYKKMIKDLETTDSEIIYNIAYCPQFNPVENINSIIKNDIRNANISDVNQIDNILKKSLKRVKQQTL